MKFDLASWRAELSPERYAVWSEDRWYSYDELNSRATRLAAHLSDMGIRPGARVGLLAPNHLAHFDLLLAAPKLGFVFVPFNPRLAAPELREQVRITCPALTFCADSLSATCTDIFKGPRIALSAYEAWLAGAPARAPDPPALAPEDTQTLLFTGGSTGRPKAARISYRQVFLNATGTAAAWNLRADDCAIQATPCFHAGLHALSPPLLAVGGRVVLMPTFEPAAYLELVHRHGATLMFMVPSMYRLLTEQPGFDVLDFPHIRWAISGGAPCPPALSRRFSRRGLSFRQGYGLTEAGVNCFRIGAQDAALHPDSVGRPMPYLEAAIRRPDGQPCKPCEVGELCLRGEVVCSGYFGASADQEWQQVFREGWLWTGDLAECDAEGLYYIRGRRKEMFISGGENVYPAEVEAALSQCEGVSECAVLGVPHAHWGETGLAAIALREGVRGDASALRRELRERLAGYKLPGHYLFLDVLPKTATGKIDKPAIRSRFEVGPEGVDA